MATTRGGGDRRQAILEGAFTVFARRGYAQACVKEVAAEAGTDISVIYELCITGNVTMLQLALGIDPEPLSMAPFTIAARRLPDARASDFGARIHERAPAVVFPALGAYVGPDIVAGVLSTGLTLDKRVRLFIDVGTNSEIVLGSSANAVVSACLSFTGGQTTASTNLPSNPNQLTSLIESLLGGGLGGLVGAGG